MESDLLAKINATLGPLLGAEKFRAGVSVECDLTGGEQSEEIFDPARSVMASSQRTEDSSGPPAASGVPGTASTLPRPTSRPGQFRESRIARHREHHLPIQPHGQEDPPAGGRAAQDVAGRAGGSDGRLGEGGRRDTSACWSRPKPEKLKVIRDLVAGITGFNAERGDQLIVETLPFEITLLTEPPDSRPPGPAKPAPAPLPFGWSRQTLAIAGGVALALMAGPGGVVAAPPEAGVRRGGRAAPAALPAGESGETGMEAAAGSSLEDALEAKLAERDALQRKMDAQALSALKLAPPITKTAEVLAKHLREKIKQDRGPARPLLQTWIREEEG